MPAPRIGFRFVPMPVEIWDGDHNDLTFGEIRLYGYLMRHQFRIGQPVVLISHDELVHGVWKTPRRERVDRGCGLVRNAVKRALESLAKRGWIEVNDVSPNSRPNLAVRALFTVEVSSGDTFDEPPKVSSGDTKSVIGGQEKCHPVTLLSTSNRDSPEEVDTPRSPLEGGAQNGEKQLSSGARARAVIRRSIFPYYIATVKPDGEGIYTLTDQRLKQGVLRFLETLDKCKDDWEKAERVVKIAIDTMARSDFHMGRMAKTDGRKYNDWKHLFRSAEKLEEWFVRSGEDAHA